MGCPGGGWLWGVLGAAPHWRISPGLIPVPAVRWGQGGLGVTQLVPCLGMPGVLHGPEPVV